MFLVSLGCRYGAVEDGRAEEARGILADTLRCNYTAGSQGERLLAFLSKSAYKNWQLHNIRLRNLCEDEARKNRDCFNPGLVGDVCRQHPLQLVKVP